MNKKFIAILMATAVSAATMGCGSDSISSNDQPAPTQEQEKEQEKEVTQEGETSEPEEVAEALDQVIIGSTTEVNADFFNGWSNGQMNAAAKELMNGYATYEFVESGVYELNDVAIKDVQVTENEVGKTYTFTIADNLVYNDGSKITAKDYVFSVMLGASPEFGALEGANNTGGNKLLGFSAFNSGETRSFEGVRLIDEYTFSLTVPASEFPYFYETTLYTVGPEPIAVIAPGVDIVDTENGATWDDNFTEELIRETILDPETGYRYKPMVTDGPYQFVSYDPATKQAILEINDKYLGRTGDGATGSIETLILKKVSDATQMDELRAGQVDLLPGISGGESINTGLEIVDEGNAGYVSYPRSGYGKIAFSCDFGPTQFMEVRQAIAYSLDRNEFASQYTGGYGTLTHGYYGASQWEYKENREALMEELNQYTYNLDKAKEVLEAGGWTLNESGAAFVEGTDAVRYKEVDGELMPLIIEWSSTPDNPVSALISTMLVPEAEKIGMKINQNVMDFTLLLEHLYRNGSVDPENPEMHMFNLGTGFAKTNPVWYYASTDPAYFGVYNSERIVDEVLEGTANEMKATDPTDVEAWSSKWLDYQKRYNELVVNLPLYSDEYHEFFDPSLQNYEPEGLWSWQDAILRAY